MKLFRSYNEFRETWLILDNLINHSVKHLQRAKKEVSGKTHEKMKLKMRTKLAETLERLGKIWAK